MGLLVGGTAHEPAHHRQVRVGGVVGETLEAFGVGVVVGSDPRVGLVGADELEAERPHPPAAGGLDGKFAGCAGGQIN